MVSERKRERQGEREAGVRAVLICQCLPPYTALPLFTPPTHSSLKPLREADSQLGGSPAGCEQQDLSQSDGAHGVLKQSPHENKPRSPPCHDFMVGVGGGGEAQIRVILYMGEDAFWNSEYTRKLDEDRAVYK